MKLLGNPHNFTPPRWNHLCRLAGLKRDHWGAGWIRLHRLWNENPQISERTAVTALKSIARQAEAAENLTALAPTLVEIAA